MQFLVFRAQHLVKERYNNFFYKQVFNLNADQ